MQDWLQIPVIQSSAVICKNEDGSDITQDVDVLVWWRDVGQARCPHITVMSRQFLVIPVGTSVFSLKLNTRWFYRSDTLRPA
jgi:hypothetical protein